MAADEQTIRVPGGAARWVVVLHVFALAGLVWSYWSLVTLGTRYGFASGVEYWLFRPTDYAPAVVLVLSGWLLYRRWPRLRSLPRNRGPHWLLALLLGLGVAVFVWAIYTSAHDLQILSLALNAAGFVVAYWGMAGLRALWLPIVFLLFAIPLPAPMLLAVIFKLQMWTADYAGWLLYLLGIPALVSGDQILRVSQAFQVVEGCSGMRSIQTLSMLTVLLIDLFGRRSWHAASLLLVAPFVAFVLNGFRVVTLIVNPHSEIVAIHNLQGIAILLIGLVLIYLFDGVLERAPRLAGEPWRPSAAPAGRVLRKSWVPLSLLLLVSATSSAAALWFPVWRDPAPRSADLYDVVQGALAEWSSVKLDPDYVFRGSLRLAQVVDRRFELEDASVFVFVATADLGQRGGSVLSPMTARPGSGWLLRDSEPTFLEPDGRPAQERLLEKGKQRVLLRHYYDGSGGLAVESVRSLFALDRSPLRRTEPMLVVRMATPVASRSDEARDQAAARLDRVYQRLGPALDLMVSASVAGSDRTAAR